LLHSELSLIITEDVKILVEMIIADKIISSMGLRLSLPFAIKGQVTGHISTDQAIGE
jgi:hypothetical protein